MVSGLRQTVPFGSLRKTVAVLSESDTMNSRHRKTIEKVFSDPVRSDVEWRDIESLVTGLGGEIKEGAGSRVLFKLNGIPAVFHRPHPRKETDKGALKSFRRFLVSAGVQP